MLNILLEEEYGYRYWCWEFPGTKEELIADWTDGKIPIANSKNYRGKLKKLTPDEVEVHHLNPKYDGLWVKDVMWMDEEEWNKAFNSPEYKAIQDAFKKDLNDRWPLNGHVFMEDDTYLMVDGKKYVPNYKK